MVTEHSGVHMGRRILDQLRLHVVAMTAGTGSCSIQLPALVSHELLADRPRAAARPLQPC